MLPQHLLCLGLWVSHILSHLITTPPIRQMLLLALFPNEEAKARKGKALSEAQLAATEGGRRQGWAWGVGRLEAALQAGSRVQDLMLTLMNLTLLTRKWR